MNHRDFLAGVAVGIIVATFSNYYFFCSPETRDIKTGAGPGIPSLMAVNDGRSMLLNWPSWSWRG